jgi:hypothetical protein
MYESEGRIIKNITFADEEVDSYGSDEGGTVPVSATVAPRTEDPLWMPLIKEEVKSRSRGYVHATLGLDNMQSSWWGAFTATGSPARGSSNSNKSSSGGVGNSNVPLSKQFLLEKYQNTVGEMLSDYALYRKLENKNKLARKVSEIRCHHILSCG